MSVPVTIDARGVDFADLRLDLDLVDHDLTTLEQVGWLVLQQAVEQGKADESLLEKDEDYQQGSLFWTEVLDEQDEGD